MASQDGIPDNNRGRSLIAESSTVAGETVRLKADPATGALLTSGGGGGGGGGGDASAANQTIMITDLGSVTETAPATDTASSGLNGRLQRIAQRVTSLIALLPASLGQKARAASLAVTLSTEDVTAMTAITGFATEATLDARSGSLTEAAPASDTASSGLNGRLQRVAQRLTSLIALFPASLGSKTSANSFAVVVASDQGAVAVTQGTAVNSNSNSASSATKSNVSGANTSTTLLSSNANRKGVAIWNDSTAILYVDISGGTASTTSTTVKLIADAYYELPAPIVTNAVTGIWATATGAARITEW